MGNNTKSPYKDVINQINVGSERDRKTALNDPTISNLSRNDREWELLLKKGSPKEIIDYIIKSNEESINAYVDKMAQVQLPGNKELIERSENREAKNKADKAKRIEVLEQRPELTLEQKVKYYDEDGILHYKPKSPQDMTNDRLELLEANRKSKYNELLQKARELPLGVTESELIKVRKDVMNPMPPVDSHLEREMQKRNGKFFGIPNPLSNMNKTTPDNIVPPPATPLAGNPLIKPDKRTI